MRTDLLRRVRWPNVALTLGALAIVPTLVAWPLTATRSPALPVDTPRPLVAMPLDGFAATLRFQCTS